MRLPSTNPGVFGAPIDHQKSYEIIDLAMANGINYYDTAYVYNKGESEVTVGEALAKYPRDSYYLATKFNYRANPDYKAVFAQQLERLQTDHIDFYLIHCLLDSNIDDYLTCGCIEYFEQMQKEGKITYLGFSSHASVETLRRFADVRKWDFAQLQVNYLDWEFKTTKEEYQVLTDRNIPIMVMEPVRGGRLSDLNSECNAKLKAAQPDCSISSWAFRWLMNQKNILVILSGMSTLEQVEDNLKTFSSEENALTPEQSELLINVAHEFKASLTVPCTGCRYCTDGCPMGLEIPELLSIYNKSKYDRHWNNAWLEKFGEKLPSTCIACGNCTSHCPQGIDIPSYMAKMSKLMETGKED
ncbi:MAG: aldo/keto reductase [Sphaerochaetaceae bacterium]|nr:aldo/keto reductase [Sphaerochaetaceae bacterium]